MKVDPNKFMELLLSEMRQSEAKTGITPTGIILGPQEFSWVQTVVIATMGPVAEGQVPGFIDDMYLWGIPGRLSSRPGFSFEYPAKAVPALFNQLVTESETSESTVEGEVVSFDNFVNKEI